MTEGRRESSSAPSGRTSGPDADAEPERVGPLLLERHRKADGRPLLLYREGEAADDG